MSQIFANTAFSLNGVNSYTIGADTFNWFPGPISGTTDIFVQNATAVALTATITLAGDNWNVNQLSSYSGPGPLQININDLGTGANRNLQTVNLFGAGSQINLVNTSLRNLNCDEGNDIVSYGTGFFDTVKLAGGNNTFSTNSFVGFVSAYNGNDTVTINGGGGMINLGDGTNTFNLNGGYVQAITGYNGNDTVKQGADTHTNSINLGQGNNIYTGGFQSGFESLVAYDGDDTVTAYWAGAVNLGRGTNTVTVNEYFTSIKTEEGNDTVTVNGGETINVGAGTNKIAVTGGVQSIVGYEGNDTVTIGNGANATLIDVGDGTNTINIGTNAFVYSIVGGGPNTLTVGAGSEVDFISFWRLGNNTINFKNNTAGQLSWCSAIQTGDGNDKITMGAGVEAQSIHSGRGNDIVTTGSGIINQVRTSDGNDTINMGSGGISSIAMGNGNDKLNVIPLTDPEFTVYCTGGDGTDTISFAAFTSALKVSIATTAENDTGHGQFIILGFDNVTGGSGQDIITGNATNNILLGGANSDTLVGGMGADLLNGGDGSDTASYQNATAGVTVSLLNAAINTGEAVGDAYVMIEALEGSKYNDFLFGDNGNNILIGGGGYDLLNGGGGTDTASYQNATAGVTVSLLNPVINTGEAVGDAYVMIEALEGSKYADFLVGNNGNNTINGGLGNDVLTGGLGNDNFRFNNAPRTTTNMDIIMDFKPVNDTIELDDAVYLGFALGSLDPNLFWASTTGKAHDTSDRIVYDTDDGKLYYDPDGTGSSGYQQIAKLEGNPVLTNLDFVVI